MSWEQLAQQPYEMKQIDDTPYDEVTFSQFVATCIAYGEWLIKAGTDPAVLQNPYEYVTQADILRFVSVVSAWPHNAPQGFNCPKWSWMLQCLRKDNPPVRTFAQELDRMEGRILTWMEQKGIDPNLVNESKADKEARQNRTRVQRHRDNKRVLEGTVADPFMVELIHQEKVTRESIAKGKAWLKELERMEKSKRDVAVAAAKLHYTQTVSAGSEWVRQAVETHEAASLALESYRSTKQ